MSPPQQLRQRTSNCSSLLICRPRKDERLSWPSWLTYNGWFTHISGHWSPISYRRVDECHWKWKFAVLHVNFYYIGNVNTSITRVILPTLSRQRLFMEIRSWQVSDLWTSASMRGWLYRRRTSMSSHFWANCLWYYQNDKQFNFCTEITFIIRVIPSSAKGSANYE